MENSSGAFEHDPGNDTGAFMWTQDGLKKTNQRNVRPEFLDSDDARAARAASSAEESKKTAAAVEAMRARPALSQQERFDAGQTIEMKALTPEEVEEAIGKARKELQ